MGVGCLRRDLDGFQEGCSAWQFFLDQRSDHLVDALPQLKNSVAVLLAESGDVEFEEDWFCGG